MQKKKYFAQSVCEKALAPFMYADERPKMSFRDEKETWRAELSDP